MKARALAACVVAACLLAAVVTAWRYPVQPDPAWLLWMGSRVLDGAEPYRALYDPNPPFTIWLHAGVALLGRAASIPIWHAFRVAVIAWCLACVALTACLARYGRRGAFMTGAAAVILLALPGPFSGQRDHLLLAVAVPWVVLLGLRVQGIAVPSRYAILAAVGLAAGLAMKPHFMPLWSLHPILMWRRRWWRYPEAGLVPALGVIYLISVATTTHYFEYMAEWAPVYGRFHRSWLRAGVGNGFTWVAIGAVAVAASRSWRDPAARAALGAVLAAWLGAVLQAKGFAYHAWPAAALALLLLALVARWTRGLRIAATVCLALSVGRIAWDGDAEGKRELAGLELAIGRGTVAVIGITGDSAWYLAEAGHGWAIPHYSLWWLQLSHGADTVPGLPRWRAQDEWLRRSLLIEPRPDVYLFSVTKGINVPRYLAASPEWEAVLRGYRADTLVAGYEVWRRTAGSEPMARFEPGHTM